MIDVAARARAARTMGACCDDCAAGKPTCGGRSRAMGSATDAQGNPLPTKSLDELRCELAKSSAISAIPIAAGVGAAVGLVAGAIAAPSGKRLRGALITGGVAGVLYAGLQAAAIGFTCATAKPAGGA